MQADRTSGPYLASG